MDADLQLALLCQTWRVVDVLSPGIARDAKLCLDNDCCQGWLFVNLNASTWPTYQREQQEEIHLLDVETHLPIPPEHEEVLLESETGALKVKTFYCDIEQGKLQLDCLAHGAGNESISLIDVKLHIKSKWLVHGIKMD